MSIVAADLAIAFLSLFAFNHFMPQQQRARSVGTASVASVNEVNIGGYKNEEVTSFNNWHSRDGSFFGNCIANVCP
jgi:hypothetical protein